MTAAAAIEVYPSARRGWSVVAVLVLAYTASYVDRTMLTLLVKPIRASLNITDLQISYLHGLAFAVFYTGLGLPLGRLADRRNRRNMIAAGIVVWSLMTAACGLARTFAQMFMARIGVGVGEAALAPCAYSLLSDYFPPHRRAWALSVYSAAIYLGSGLALIGGGALIALVPAIRLPGVGLLASWQVVFLIVGLPGVGVALLMATVREPRRLGQTLGAARATLGDVWCHVTARRGAYGLIIAGFSASSLMWNGAQGWIPTFFMRTFGWSPAATGLRYGLVLLVLGTLGICAGGLLAGRLRRRGRPSANLLVGLLSSVMVIPFGVLAPLVPDPWLALGLYGGFVFFGAFPYGAAAAALQELTPNGMRAQVSALYLLGLNLVGIGLGPTAVAFITDKVFADDRAVRFSLAITTGLAAPLAVLLLLLALKPNRAALALPA
jgi:MFS family permease